MFDAAECLFLYLESSLRVGSGEPGEEIDLPIQREAATGYPMVPGSSLKGVLRGRARAQDAPPELLALLGSEPESDEAQPSCIVLSDSLPLLLPVRALTGLFAWVTSLETLSRFARDLTVYGVKNLKPPKLPVLAPDTASVALESPLLGTAKNLVLEDLCFPVKADEEIGTLGTWLAENAFPDDPVYQFWRERVGRGVVVLPEPAYRHFALHGTQVQQRIRIDPHTGTAAEGSLWSEEFLPPETLLYAFAGVNLPAQPPSYITKVANLSDWLKGLITG
ncbi:MAG: type III-B CRISPR module RAMP protein Cmr4, partial [Isosphaeraceae bacterium]